MDQKQKIQRRKRSGQVFCLKCVITQSLTTKRRHKELVGQTGDEDTKMDKLWFCRNEERANVLDILLHCSFHNVNHERLSKALGKITLQVI